jgi:Nicotinic acid phosphoribosyltransferase
MDLLTKQNEIFRSLKGHVPVINPFLYGTDSYKMSHIKMQTEGVKEIYSNFTPRFSKYLKDMLGDKFDNKYVVFGLQWMMLRLHMMAQEGFFNRPKDEVIAEMKEVLTPYIGNDKYDHFEALHDLGYLPIVVKTLDEGTIAPVGVPFLTIRNSVLGFEWLPNFLETIISTDLWKQLTIATVAHIFRKITNEFALETTGSIEGTEWQNHDFHVRGASGFESAAIDGVAFLLSSCGTDNIPALWAADKFYQSSNKQGLLAGSVPAGEHSVTTSGILAEVERAALDGEDLTKEQAEYFYARKIMMERFPTGIVSYVADSYDYWNFIGKILPSLKNEVMSRDGKFVVRGDSGNPVDVICGVVEDYEVIEADNEEEFLEAAYEIIHDNLQDVTPHGEYGGDDHDMNFSWNGRIYNVSFSGFQWNRYDKQYYYLDTYRSDVTHKMTEIKRNIEHKGTIEALWDIFGGHVNDKGYKVLDSHIGMIYGDGITVERQIEILTRLKNKGFASTNIVFGVGSYSLNMVSRDHLGMAIKATNQVLELDNGIVLDQPIYKDPKTDTSKKSAHGLISVHEDENGELYFKDKQNRKEEKTGLLNVLYMNGQFQKLTNIFEIREKMWD